MPALSASTVPRGLSSPRLRISCGRQPSRTRGVHIGQARCSLEAQKLFAQRLEAQGWERPRPREDMHPLVKETLAAMDCVYGLGVLETPLEPAPWLKEAGSGDVASVHLKMETHQVTGSFKARGAAHKLLSLAAAGILEQGITASSTGNHALAVLHACSALAAAGRPVDATIYVPSTLAPQKAAKLQTAAAIAGARIVVHGSDCVDAEREARTEAERSGKAYVSPYNDLAVAGGQGTLAMELLMALPPHRLDAVFVPVGGGGLVSGVAALLKEMHPSVRVYGCQPERSDVMRRSVAEGRVVELPWRETLSDATAGGVEEGAATLATCARFVDEWVTVGEDEIAAAMVKVHGYHAVVPEGAAGVAVAAFVKRATELRGQHVVIVCCGGNAAQETLDAAYGMVRARGSLAGNLHLG